MQIGIGIQVSVALVIHNESRQIASNLLCNRRITNSKFQIPYSVFRVPISIPFFCRWRWFSQLPHSSAMAVQLKRFNYSTRNGGNTECGGPGTGPGCHLAVWPFGHLLNGQCNQIALVLRSNANEEVNKFRNIFFTMQWKLLGVVVAAVVVVYGVAHACEQTITTLHSLA